MEKELFKTIKKQLAEREAIIEKQRNRILLLQEKLNEVRETVSVLEAEKEKLKNSLKSKEEELGKIKGAFDRLQEELVELKSKLREREKLIEDLKKEREAKKVADVDVQTEQIRMYENLLKQLQDKFVNLQLLIAKAVAGDKRAIEKLRTTILKEGPLEAKILMLIYTEGVSNINELAEKIEMPKDVLGSLLFMFEEEGLIKLEAEKIYVPMKEKIEKISPPPTTSATSSPLPATAAEEAEKTEEMIASDTSTLFEEWKTLPTEEIYDRLLAFCRKYSTLPDKIGDALEIVCDILEGRLKTFGGRIRFEMRREANDWRRGLGDFSELELKIADWKRRAKKVVEY